MSAASWIVVGTDFGEAADHALASAIELAAATHASVALVHAYLDPPDRAIEIDELRGALTAAIARSPAVRLGVHVEPLLRRGTPWEKLHNVATDMGADRIVIGAGALGARAVAGARPAVLVIRSTRIPR